MAIQIPGAYCAPSMRAPLWRQGCAHAPRLFASRCSINSFVSQNWTVALGFEETQPWRPWTVDAKQQMGGYVTRYEKDFDFLTIRGAGHMVPEYKSAASLEFVSRWLLGQDWQRYNATARR